MEKNRSDKKIFVIIIFSMLFGLFGGIFGEIIARIYIFENAFNIPFFGEINYAKNLNGTSNVVIRDAKKVVVEQDQRIGEVSAMVKNSMVGFYTKDSGKTLNIPGDSTNNGKVVYYKNDGQAGEGVVITSDGWIMTNFHPKEFAADTGKDAANIKKQNSEIAKNYVILDKDKNVYVPDKIIFDYASNVSFWHIPATDLAVSKFSFGNQTENGQSAIATNWRGWAWLAVFVDQVSTNNQDVNPSDKFAKQIILDSAPKKEFVGSFLYNLNGEIIALIDDVNKIDSIDNYNPIINSLLHTKTIKRPSLGVNYINLANIFNTTADKTQVGALIAKSKDNIAVVLGGVAEKAGLKENDIIKTINNTEINSDNSLNKIISQYLPGDNLAISYTREGISKDIQVKLGELK